MNETSEANSQPNCAMVAEPEQEAPRWSAAGCDVEQARSAAAPIKVHRGRTMAESCAEATKLWAFGDSVRLYCHC